MRAAMRSTSRARRFRTCAGAGRGLSFKHIGLYGYRRDFLLRFAALPQTPLELAESLEQLRALEHGYRIRHVVTAAPTPSAWTRRRTWSASGASCSAVEARA